MPREGQDEPLCESLSRLMLHTLIARSLHSIKKGDIISIPIQAMNKSKSIFGQDAEKFKCVNVARLSNKTRGLWWCGVVFSPERWERPPDPKAMPTLYSSILTFLYGGRACIGYRFALLEYVSPLSIMLDPGSQASRNDASYTFVSEWRFSFLYYCEASVSNPAPTSSSKNG